MFEEEFLWWGFYGMHWTRSAFHKQFVLPLFEPVLEHFDGLTQETDARKVLDKLLEEHDLWLIHDSLIDMLENSYPAKPVMKLVGEIFFCYMKTKNFQIVGIIDAIGNINKKNRQKVTKNVQVC